MTLGRIKFSILMLMVVGYLVLTYGFMQLRIPPGGIGIPIGEMVLLVYLMTVNWARVLHDMGRTTYLPIFFMWWGYGTIMVTIGALQNGPWALRDATSMIESLYIIVGFAVASNPRQLDKFFRWLGIAALLYVVMLWGYFDASTLRTLSPTLQGGQGQEVALMFHYAFASNFVLWAAAGLLLFFARHPRWGKFALVGAGLLIAFSLVIVQARLTYLQILALFALFLLLRRSTLTRATLLVPLMFIGLGLFLTAGIQVSGRLTQQVDFDFFVNHVLSIVGMGQGGEGIEQANSGVPLRLQWWQSIWDQLTEGIHTLLFGLGYGIPLVDFGVGTEGVKVREPHNSYLSLLARLGFVGVFLWVALHVFLLSAWWRAWRFARRMGWQEWDDRLMWLMCFFILLWVAALPEDGFEKPFFAIPYYLMWGVVLRTLLHFKDWATTSHVSLAEDAPTAAPSRPSTPT
ncbi:MAG: O-antigen ligase family protein [Rhodospirillaceae bacterium]